jgi:hypothetical protein
MGFFEENPIVFVVAVIVTVEVWSALKRSIARYATNRRNASM